MEEDISDTFFFTKKYSNTSKIREGYNAKSKDTKQPKILTREPLTTKYAIEFLLAGTLRSKVCRYCLNISNWLSELDQIFQIAGKGAIYKVTVRDMIASFHPVKVIDDPNFPNKICEKCLNRVMSSYLFMQQCEQSERAIRNCFEDIFDKLEKLDPLERTKKRGRQKLHPNYNILYVEHDEVIDYAEPIINLINYASERFVQNEDATTTIQNELECKKCWNTLPNLQSLMNHERSHPKTMWYGCKKCGKSFVKYNQLKKHLNTHIDEQPAPGPKFKCNACGHNSDCYNQHLQHTENHKFKTVIKHLVERKMNVLCTICLNKDAHMTDLDKMICIHGGYPELTGDRTLYSILGTTLPDPNAYKYQELLVPNKANVMKIVKKNKVTKLPSSNPLVNPNRSYVISNPIIISADGANCDCTLYSFMFSKPEKINYSNEIVEESNNTLVIKHDDSHSNDHEMTVNDLHNDTLDKTQDNITHVDNIKDIANTEDFVEIKPAVGFCKTCLLFNKAVCKECIELNDNTTAEFNDTLNTTNNINNNTKDTIIIDKPCNVCWVFKHLEKCEHCKKPNKIHANKNFLDINCDSKEENVTQLSIQSESIQPELNNNKIIEIGKNKKTLWQCEVCLTKNKIERDTCLCCETLKSCKGEFKINYGLKNIFERKAPVLKYIEKTETIISTDKNETTIVDYTLEINQNQTTARNSETIDKIEDGNMDMEILDIPIPFEGASKVETMDFEDVPATNIGYLQPIYEKMDMTFAVPTTSFQPACNLTFNVGTGCFKNRKFKKAVKRHPV